MNAEVKRKAKAIEESIKDMKKTIAHDISLVLKETDMTQTDAAFAMNDAPSQVSLVVTGKLRGFSLERLIRMRALLGAHLTLTIAEKGTSKVAVKKIA